MIKAVLGFLTTPQSPRPLAFLRIGLAILLLLNAALMWHMSSALLGDDGMISAHLRGLLAKESVPQFRQLATIADWLGMDQVRVVHWSLVLHAASLCFMLFGIGRLSTTIAWLSYLVLKTACGATIYGVHDFLNIGMFYCVVFPSGGHIVTVDPESQMAGLGRRILQLHLTIVYVSSGFWKAIAGEHWWNGNAVWWAVSDPLLKGCIDVSWIAWTPSIALLMGWATLGCEFGYGVLMWNTRTRPFGLATIVLMHVGIAVVLGLWLFAVTMILLNLVAWLPEHISAYKHMAALLGQNSLTRWRTWKGVATT